MKPKTLAVATLLCVAALCLLCCAETRQPDYAQVVVLEGSPYERGLQHGRLLAGRIRSLYATLLPNSLLPYLNRERVDVASVLFNYKDAEDNPESHYAQWMQTCSASCRERCGEKCSFSYMLMKESAESMWLLIPQEYRDEMQGIADGAAMPLEEILILNTFVDTMLAFRSLTVFIKQLQAPYITEAEFLGDLDSDGIDNNCDGITDRDDGLMKPWRPSPDAAFIEIPAEAVLRLGLNDIKLGVGTDKGDQAGVDPCTLRIQHNEIVYAFAEGCSADESRTLCLDGRGKPCPMLDDLCDACLYTRASPNGKTSLDVFFKPPGGFEKAALSSLVIQAGDFNRIVNPPPVHARFMRDERMTISGAGYGAAAHEIDNRGFEDGRSQPPSISFAVRGAATPAGEVLAAHHYALLDSNTTHKHTVLFVIKPEQGLPHVVLGYAGLVWGFSGMNSEGLVFSFNNSDSLDNPMSGHFEQDLINAMLLCDAVPIGLAGRAVLAGSAKVSQAAEYIKSIRRSFGWNVQLTDASGGMLALETDSDILSAPDGGVLLYAPPDDMQNRSDEHGRAWASTGKDDLRMASHFRMNSDDLHHTFLVFEAKPQRYWTSFYYRSVRAWSILGSEIENRYGDIDLPRAIEILRTPELVDERDSMQAVVYRPQTLKLHYAMGTVPATDGEFVEFDLAAALEEGGRP